MTKTIKFPKELLGGIKTHLEEEMATVKAQIADLTLQDPFADSDRLNDNAASDTEAKEEFNHDRVEAMIEELKTKQTSLEAALSRIEKNTYGNCVNCGEMIDTDRLGAIPTATLCMSCQEKKKR